MTWIIESPVASSRSRPPLRPGRGRGAGAARVRSRARPAAGTTCVHGCGPAATSHGPPSFHVTNTCQTTVRPSRTPSAPAAMRSESLAPSIATRALRSTRAWPSTKPSGPVGAIVARRRPSRRPMHTRRVRTDGPRTRQTKRDLEASSWASGHVAREAQRQEQLAAGLRQAGARDLQRGRAGAGGAGVCAVALPAGAAKARQQIIATSALRGTVAKPVRQPPAIAGRITITSPPPTAVSRPSSTRTSSSLR